jgi:hypothetical protein
MKIEIKYLEMYRWQWQCEGKVNSLIATRIHLHALSSCEVEFTYCLLSRKRIDEADGINISILFKMLAVLSYLKLN